MFLGGDLEKYVPIKFIHCKWNLIYVQGAEAKAENVPCAPLTPPISFPPLYFITLHHHPTPPNPELAPPESIFHL